MERWPIKFHPRTRGEIKDAVVWYRDIDESLSVEFSDALDVAMGRIARSPRQWPVYVDEYRHVLLDRFPYIVVYRVDETEVQVMAVAHAKRRPGYWLSRAK